MSHATEALARIESARRYTQAFLDDIAESDWFRMPEGVTHVAWQVGHLAIAQYRLCLQRQRGRLAGDDDIIPSTFVDLFAKGSLPDASPEHYPPVADIRGAFDRVYREVCREATGFTDNELTAASEPAHPMFRDRRGALEWCAAHEMLHAGQIGLLRRLFGARWLR